MNRAKAKSWATLTGRAAVGGLFALLALTVFTHACVLLLEALALALIAVVTATLILPGRWRFVRSRLAGLAASWTAAAQAWAETGIRRAVGFAAAERTEQGVSAEISVEKTPERSRRSGAASPAGLAGY